MDLLPEPPPADAAAAARDLERVQHKVEAARAVLLRLLQEVVVAESRLSQTQAAQLLEANEQLVLSALRDQAQAETASMALSEGVRAAEVDALTQLPNRALMLDRLKQAIAVARRHGGRMAVLFVDLDDFKQINDNQGHAAGDEVLQQVASALAGAVREADTVSRHGGDEFLILLGELSQRADAALIAAKVQAALQAPLHAAGQLRHLTASIGISVCPDDAEDPLKLIEQADAAMYRAKREGPGRIAFHGEAAGPPRAPLQAPLAAEHERRSSQLQEANERLVLSALSAQELQAAAERARLRQAEFMDAVAEELANPMTPIRLASAMLGRAGNHEPLLPRVQALIEQQVGHMSRLVAAAGTRSHALPAAAPGSGPGADLATVVDAALQASRPLVELRQQTLHVNLPPRPATLAGDRESLEQVLCNLLDNASRYTLEQGVIRLEAALAGENLVLTLADDGIGITPEAVGRLFEPFAQDSHAIGLNGVGAGLGLPVVRLLVQELGGTVSAESAGRRQGSRFVVTLPLAQAPGVAAGPGLAPAAHD